MCAALARLSVTHHILISSLLLRVIFVHIETNKEALGISLPLFRECSLYSGRFGSLP